MKRPSPVFTIAPDPLEAPEVLALLELHLEEMHRCSPSCKVHALDAGRLKEPGVTFFAARHDGDLAAVGALKRLGAGAERSSPCAHPTAFVAQALAKRSCCT